MCIRDRFRTVDRAFAGGDTAKVFSSGQDFDSGLDPRINFIKGRPKSCVAQMVPQTTSNFKMSGNTDIVVVNDIRSLLTEENILLTNAGITDKDTKTGVSPSDQVTVTFGPEVVKQVETFRTVQTLSLIHISEPTRPY